MSLLDSLPGKSGSLLDSLPDQSQEQYPNVDQVPATRRIFDPADTQREVMGVHALGTPVFKTPQQRDRAITELADVPATLGGMIASPVVQAGAGLVGLGSIIKDDLTYGKPMDRAGSLTRAAQIIQSAEQSASYQPVTPAGQATQAAVSYPFRKLTEAGQYVGEKTEEATGSPTAGALADTAVNMTPFLLPFVRIGGKAGLKAVRESEAYRKMTVPERGLVVQTYDDMLKAGVPEAELARKNPEYFREAVKRRSKGESALDTAFPKEDMNVQEEQTQTTHGGTREAADAVPATAQPEAMPDLQPVDGRQGDELPLLQPSNALEEPALDTQQREGISEEPTTVEGETPTEVTAQEVQANGEKTEVSGPESEGKKGGSENAEVRVSDQAGDAGRSDEAIPSKDGGVSSISQENAMVGGDVWDDVAIRPAVKLPDGKTVTGDLADRHDAILQGEGIEPGTTGIDRGFVDANGKFLSRGEAYAHIEENNPTVYEELKKAGVSELHSQDLAAATSKTQESSDDGISRPGELGAQTVEQASATLRGEGEGQRGRDPVGEVVRQNTGRPLEKTSGHAVLESLSTPQPITSLRTQHGKDTIDRLVSQGRVTYAGDGTARITNRGAKWLKDNPPAEPAPTETVTIQTGKTEGKKTPKAPLKMDGTTRPPKAAKEPLPGFESMPKKTRQGFDEAWTAKDIPKLKEWLHPDNKNLRAEFENRAGEKLPKTVKGTDAAVEEYFTRANPDEVQPSIDKESLTVQPGEDSTASKDTGPKDKAAMDRLSDLAEADTGSGLSDLGNSLELKSITPEEFGAHMDMRSGVVAFAASADLESGDIAAAEQKMHDQAAVEERLTSLKNDVTAAESGPQDKWQFTRDGIIEEGKRLVDSGAYDPRRAALEIVENPHKIISHEQQAALLYDRQRIYNEYDALADNIAKAMADNDGDEINKLRQDRARLEDALQSNAQAATYLGTGWSAFGQVRQAFMDKDYSALWLQTRAKAALGVDDLPENLKKEFEDMAAQIRKLEADHQAAVKNAEEEATQKAIERIHKEVKSKKTVQREKSAEGQSVRDKEFKSLSERLKKVLDPYRISMNLDPEAVAIVADMAKLKIMDGVTGAKQIVDDIYSELAGQFDVSKRDIQDAISGYGETRELSQDEINVTLREVKRQLRLFSALEDAEGGQVPLHSGVQRDPVSDEVRELTKKVKAVMRDTGLDAKDQTPEQQWRTAMDTVHTRLKNQIHDLEKQIGERRKTERPLKKLDYDAEAKALQTLRDEKRQTLEEIDQINKLMEKEAAPDETPEMAKLRKFMTDTEKSVAAEERRIGKSAENYDKKASGEVEPAKPKTHIPDTPRLDHLRKERDAAKARYEAARDATKPAKDPEASRVKAAFSSLEKAIERNEKALRGETPEKQGQGAPVSKELALRRVYNDSLRQSMKEMKDSQKIPKDPEEAKMRAYKSRLLKRENDLNEMLVSGNFEKSARKILKLDSEAERIAARVAQKKEEVEGRMRQLQRSSMNKLERRIYIGGKALRFSILSGTKVLWKISVASMVTRPLQTTLEEAAGSFNLFMSRGAGSVGRHYRAIDAGAPRQGGGLNVKAEAAAYVQWFKSEQYKNMWDELRQGKMSIEIQYGGKVGEHGEHHEDRRGIQTWGKTKLDHFDYLADFPGRLHGTLKAVAYTQEFYRALQIITENYMRNGKDMGEPINQLVVKNLAEAEANRARLMSDHVMQGAYKSVLRHIEQRGTVGGRLAGALIRANFPITKVPLNYFSESTSFLPGVGYAKAKLVLASARMRVKDTPEGRKLVGEALFDAAMEEMTPQEKDAYIRSMKKHTVGVVVAATIGYFLYKHFGGFYRKGEKRKRGELKEGEISIDGVNFSSTWFHAPVFEAFQAWAMVHHMEDLANRKEDKAEKSAKRHHAEPPERASRAEKMAEGALAAGVGMVERVPYVGTPIRVWDQLQSYQGGKDYLQSLALRALVPQLLVEASKNRDKVDDVVIPRESKTIAQKIMVAVPGMREKLPIDPKKLKRMDIGDLAVLSEGADKLKLDAKGKKMLADIFGSKLKHDYRDIVEKDPDLAAKYLDIRRILRE